MRRLVVLYCEREGSSALMEAINTRTNVNVPINEHMDAWWFTKAAPDADPVEALQKLLDTGELSHGPAWNMRVLKTHWSPVEDIDGFGFKWRPFGGPARVMRVMKRYDVTVIFLHRALLDAVASLYVSRAVLKQGEGEALGAGHFQFKFRNLPEEEQKRVRARLDGLQLRLDPFLFYYLALRRVYQEAHKLRYLRRAHMSGLSTAVVSYSDIMRDMDAAVDYVLQAARIPVLRHETGPPDLTFRKASHRPSTEKLRHFWLIRWNPLTWLIVGLDHAIAAHARRLGRRHLRRAAEADTQARARTRSRSGATVQAGDPRQRQHGGR